MSLRYNSLSKSGKGKMQNEDSIGIVQIDDGLLCIVCDGLGGGVDAAKASRFCVKTIQEYFLDSPGKNYLTKIKESVHIANALLCDLSTSKYNSKGMTTTSDVFFLNNQTLYWGHIGDSRIYNFVHGKLHQLTKDHSLVQEMLDNGYISVEDAAKHPNKNIILNALGEYLDVEIDVSKMKLNHAEHYRFLICSDGVNVVLNNYELEQILNIIDIDECLKVLDEKIQSGGSPDDYSIILIDSVN
jgi:PPM family protein phosphatase